MRRLLIALLSLVLAGAAVDLMLEPDPAEPSDVQAMDDPGDIPPSPKP